jgi:probable F420-dependent oxidoreductase
MRADTRPGAESGSRQFKVGIDLIACETAMSGETPRWADIRAMAETAEAAGFDSIWVPDHFLVPTGFWLSSGEGSVGLGNWECWSVLSALASVTSRVQLGTLVLGSGYRNPALLAKMADTLDEISDGRLILGLGSGWIEHEYRAFGYPYDHRVSRFEEAVQIIGSLLKAGYVDFDGKFYRASACELRPRGPRPNGPPIMIGSRSPRMHRIAARYADVWNGSWSASAEGLSPMLAAIDTACDEVGRDPGSLTRTAGVLVALPGEHPSRERNVIWRQMLAGNHLTGSIEEIAAELLRYRARGISHVQVILDPLTVEGIEAFAGVLELIHRVQPEGSSAGQTPVY